MRYFKFERVGDGYFVLSCFMQAEPEDDFVWHLIAVF